ncbi:MAG: hypothetical protein L6R39_000088 [Caloplaca ligustica]|nr:MAG: hypothetical protein L6R39_000088 [Caloplaca ligustica]
MVTAILPSTIPKNSPDARLLQVPDGPTQYQARESYHSRRAGLAGLFAGTGALLAVGLYLPLPSRLQKLGVTSERALADTYYLAGATAIVVAIACYLGLNPGNSDPNSTAKSSVKDSSVAKRASESFSSIPKALRLGLTQPSLGLAFLASFVARSSSVGISLFIPLFVNASLCNQPAQDIGDIRNHCRRAYVIAAQLTGVSQMFALIFAPIYGFLPHQHGHFHVPLMLAAVSGAVGYIAFAKMNTSETSPKLFVVVALLGVSQIGAIVASLSLVSSFVNEERSLPGNSDATRDSSGADCEEISPLIDRPSTSQTYGHLKGAIAGIYSFFGSLAILILTKLGGLLFDQVGPGSPFYLLALFNVSLLLAAFGYGVLRSYKGTN